MCCLPPTERFLPLARQLNGKWRFALSCTRSAQVFSQGFKLEGLSRRSDTSIELQSPVICFDNEIDLASSERLDGKKVVNFIRRLFRLSCWSHCCATGHCPYVMSRASTNLVLVQLEFFRYWQETTDYKNEVSLLPKQLDVIVASFHLPSLGPALTVFFSRRLLERSLGDAGDGLRILHPVQSSTSSLTGRPHQISRGLHQAITEVEANMPLHMKTLHILFCMVRSLRQTMNGPGLMCPSLSFLCTENRQDERSSVLLLSASPLGSGSNDLVETTDTLTMPSSRVVRNSRKACSLAIAILEDIFVFPFDHGVSGDDTAAYSPRDDRGSPGQAAVVQSVVNLNKRSSLLREAVLQRVSLPFVQT